MLKKGRPDPKAWPSDPRRDRVIQPLKRYSKRVSSSIGEVLMSEKITDKLSNRTKKAISNMNVSELVSLAGLGKTGLILQELQDEQRKKKTIKAKPA